MTDIDKTLSVFISYSWDNEQHQEWVLNLANKLSGDGSGLYVILDRYDLKVGKPMTQFMEKAVNQADKVLLIMTPNYKDKADNRMGGVGYEYSMITQELYEKQDNDKFIPIRRNGNYDECAPKFLKSFISFDMTNNSTFEKDFNELVRIIYDEPEIKRPPIGKKPVFASKPTSKVATTLIDDKANLTASGMTTFAKWTIDIHLSSLSDQNKSTLFNLIVNNVIVDKENKQILPFVLNNNNKISHHPVILYDFPLRRFIAYNHLMQEKLLIDDGLIHYEFSEYSNNDFWLLYISQPFSTIFYLLVIIKNIHNQIGKSIDASININFNSDKRSLLYGKHSPFNYPNIFNYQTMGIPDSKADLSIPFNALTKDSVFEIFQKIYGLFVAEEPTSKMPFAYIDREHFNMVTDEFFNK